MAELFEFDAANKLGIPSTKPDSPYLGLYLAVGPGQNLNTEEDCSQYAKINFTGTAGTASALYYSLVFQLPKWEFNIVKPDEWIEVSPTMAKYYAETMRAREEIEAKIKAGLIAAAETVSRYELLAHDLRKYKEIMDYFERKDEHSLKAMFIDQVDIHTGEGISLRSIVGRWPTIIADFIKLKDEDVDPDKIAKKLNISKAEAIILTTKNKLYVEWKELFGTATKERYERIKGLVESNKMTIDEYRNWLKPHIARYKMMKVGAERPAVVKEAFKAYADITGQATFKNNIKLWAWKTLKAIEARKPAIEKVGKGFIIDPDDPFVINFLILGKDPKISKGLVSIYPWLAKDGKLSEKAKKVISEIKEEWLAGENGLDPSELYYIFFDINILRVGSRLPVGEIEDITFTIKTYTMSQNILFVKLLELKCRELELDRYIDEILGIKAGEEGEEIKEIVKREFPEVYGAKKRLSPLEQYAAGFKKMSADIEKTFATFFPKRAPSGMFVFVKPGMYESDFADRISKIYLKPAGAILAEIVKFLKAKMGVV